MTPPLRPRVIAMDGPSGSGKSTAARGVAGALGWRYVDTGATYRAVTAAVLARGVDPAAAAEVFEVVRTARIELSTDPTAPGIWLDGRDISTEIRGPEVTGAVSAVSAHPEVRQRLVALQRSLLGDGAVVEGRDIGTVVVPDAPVKVFLDAAAGVRASRRAGDSDSGVQPTGGPDVTEVAADLARRDRLDSNRPASPLLAAADAVHLDSTELSAAEVIERVLELARQAGLSS